MFLEIVENPTVKRAVEIELSRTKKPKLNMEWRRVGMAAANICLRKMTLASSHYVYDDGSGELEPISITEAAKEYVPANVDGDVIHIPVLHEGVEERDRVDILEAQKDFLHSLLVGENAIVIGWDLAASKDDSEPLPFTDEVFDMVFDKAEFFWAVWNDLQSMFGELASGKDKTKNSKTLASSGLSRKQGVLRA